MPVTEDIVPRGVGRGREGHGHASVDHATCPLPTAGTAVPPYSPELNPIERIWSFLKSHRLSNQVFVDRDDLLAAGRSAWNSLTDEQLQSICRTKWLTHEVDA
jgi:transposase